MFISSTIYYSIFCILKKYRDKRYQRKIGYSIYLEIATTNIPLVKLLTTSRWRKGGIVNVVATITESEYHKGLKNNFENETVDFLISEL